jgi:hypothetical protein
MATLTVTLEFPEGMKGISRERLCEVLGDLLYAPDVAMTRPLDELQGNNHWDWDNIKGSWVLTPDKEES